MKSRSTVLILGGTSEAYELAEKLFWRLVDKDFGF